MQAAFGRHNDAGMYVAVLLLGIVCWAIIGSVPTMVVMLKNNIIASDLSELQECMSPNSYILTTFSSFIIGLASFILLVRLMHRRGFSSVVNGRDKVRWRRNTGPDTPSLRRAHALPRRDPRSCGS